MQIKLIEQVWNNYIQIQLPQTKTETSSGLAILPDSSSEELVLVECLKGNSSVRTGNKILVFQHQITRFGDLSFVPFSAVVATHEI